MVAPSLTPGQTLGHFRIIEEIGAGGMGIVYRAWDTRLERDVAVKVLNAKTLSDASARTRFRREALILSRLNHPNVEAVYDFHSEQGVDYLVLEYARNLAERTTGKGRFTAERGACARHPVGVRTGGRPRATGRSSRPQTRQSAGHARQRAEDPRLWPGT